MTSSCVARRVGVAVRWQRGLPQQEADCRGRKVERLDHSESRGKRMGNAASLLHGV